MRQMIGEMVNLGSEGSKMAHPFLKMVSFVLHGPVYHNLSLLSLNLVREMRVYGTGLVRTWQLHLWEWL